MPETHNIKSSVEGARRLVRSVRKTEAGGNAQGPQNTLQDRIQIFGQITGTGTDNSGIGTYKVTEVVWDEVAFGWVLASEGLIWDSSGPDTNQRDLYEVSATEDILNDTIVLAMFVSDVDGTGGRWMFNYDTFKLKVSDDDELPDFLDGKLKFPNEEGSEPSPRQENLFLQRWIKNPGVLETYEVDGDIGELPAAGTLDGSEQVMVKKGTAQGSHKQTTTQEIADLSVFVEK